MDLAENEKADTSGSTEQDINITPAASSEEVDSYTTHAAVTTVTKQRKQPPVVAGLVMLLLLVAVGAAVFTIMRNAVLLASSLPVENVMPKSVMGYVQVNIEPSKGQQGALDTLKTAVMSQPGVENSLTLIKAIAGTAPASLPASGEAAQYEKQAAALMPLVQYARANVSIGLLPLSAADLRTLSKSVSDAEMGLVYSSLGDPSTLGLPQTEQQDPMVVAGPILGRSLFMVADVKLDKLQADQKNSSASIAGGTLAKSETYNGVDIQKWSGDAGATAYIALLPNSSTALIGLAVDPLHTVIDAWRKSDVLGSSKDFQALQAQVPTADGRLASLYMNASSMSDIMKMAAPAASTSTGNMSGAVLTTVSAHADGMQVESASSVRSDFSQDPKKLKRPSPNSIQAPEGTLGFWLGTDMASTLQSVLDAANNSSPNSTMGGDEMLKLLKDSTGVDIQSDVLPILGGDYFAAAYTTDGTSVHGGVQFLLPQGKGVEAAKTLSTLITRLQGSGSPSTAFSVEGGTFYWLSNQKSMGARSETAWAVGVAGDRLMVMGAESEQALTKSISDALHASSSTSAQWQEASAHALKDYTSVFFLDMKAAAALVKNMMQESGAAQYNSTVGPLLSTLRYMVTSSAVDAQGIEHSVTFLAVTPASSK